MPTARSGLGLASGNGKLYAIGGENSPNDPVTETLSTVEMYDPYANAWTTKASMPTPRAWLGVAAASNGRIYAIGGADGTAFSPGLGTVEEYSPANNTWAVRTSMPTVRFGLAAVAANGRIYAIGGSGYGGFVATVEEYDPLTDTWVAKASMPTARANLAAALGPDGLIYAVGGTNGGPSPLSTVEAYDPVADSWAAKPSMPGGRVCLGVAAGLNDRIYAIGGHDGATGMTGSVQEYDPITETWTARASMPTARQWQGVARGANGRLYVVGGQPTFFTDSAALEEATIE
jgi:N-acetylneuraminic acid mutarotase